MHAWNQLLSNVSPPPLVLTTSGFYRRRRAAPRCRRAWERIKLLHRTYRKRPYVPVDARKPSAARNEQYRLMNRVARPGGPILLLSYANTTRSSVAFSSSIFRFAISHSLSLSLFLCLPASLSLHANEYVLRTSHTCARRAFNTRRIELVICSEALRDRRDTVSGARSEAGRNRNSLMIYIPTQQMLYVSRWFVQHRASGFPGKCMRFWNSFPFIFNCDTDFCIFEFTVICFFGISHACTDGTGRVIGVNKYSTFSIRFGRG
jgi:hypothetical protein